MNIHLHQARNLTGWLIGIAAFSPFALCFEPSVPEVTLPEVTGRVAFAGRPINDMTFCMDSASGEHMAFCNLGNDGSFRLINMREGGFGARPGRYHGHLFSVFKGPNIPAKYEDFRTSGLDIDIAAGWNKLNIDLE